MFRKYLFQLIKYILYVWILSSLTSCGGGATSNSTNSEMLAVESNGVAQKGPFTIGSEVSIEKLDSSGVSFGESIRTTVFDTQGQFSFQLPTDWETDSTIRLEVTGKVFDEALGVFSMNEISLSSVVPASQQQKSINILTHWLSNRTQSLLLDGEDLNSSLQQAEQELSKIFGINNASLLDYTNSANHLLEDNASLLLLSGALMAVADSSNENIQVIINQIADDFANDGFIDQTGDEWLKRLQAEIRDNPILHTSQFSKNLEDALGFKTVLGKQLPKVINFATRPTSVVPKEIIAKPSETIVLDGSASHDSSEKSLINFTWFRVDQQSFTPSVVISDRFLESPTITVPNIESELLYALVVTDTDKLTDTSVIKVIVKKPDPVNTPPVVKDQSFVIDEDTELDFILDASDVDGDSLVYSFDTPLLLPNSILNGTPPTIKYSPDHNFNGTSDFTYTVHDGNDTSNIGTVSIEVLPVNDKPIADSQTLVTNKNQAIQNIILTASDVDKDDSLTFFTLNPPQHGSLQDNGTSYTYTPDTDYVGGDSFTFFVNDGTIDSDVATVEITVFSTNVDPIAVDDSYTVNEDTPLQLDPLAGDTDPDTDVLSIVKINGVTLTNGITQTIPVSHGQVNVSASGGFSFIPNTNFFGSVTFSYTISDGKGGTDSANENIIVTSVNDAPTAVDDSYTVSEDSSVVLTPLAGDSDPDVGDTLVVTKINGTSITKTVVNPISVDSGNGFVEVSASGELRFTPKANFSGTISFDYEISDGNGGTDSAQEIITVTANNKPPIAVDDSYTTNEDTAVPLNPLLGDTDPDLDEFVVIKINGTSITNGISQMIPVNNGQVDVDSAGSFSFVPDSNFFGTVIFSYTISDGNGGTDSAVETITVVSVNDPPSAVDDSYTVNENATIIIDPLAGDSDPDVGDTLVVTKINGTSITNTVVNPISVDSGNGFVEVSASGELRFTPKANFSGTISFSYDISDGNGGTDSALETITVVAGNVAPTAVDDEFFTNEDVTLSQNVITPNDTDPDNDPITVIAAKIDLDGDTVLDAIDLVSAHQIRKVSGELIGTIGISENGDFTFMPATNVNGNVPPLTYEISDAKGGTDSAILRITINAVNDAPTARTVFLELNQGSEITFEMGPNSDQLGGTDPEGDDLIIVEDPSGTVENSGSISSLVDSVTGEKVYTYKPAASFCGTDSFEYEVKEVASGQLISPPATVTFNVICSVKPKSAYIKAQTPDPVPSFDGGDDFGSSIAMSADGTILAVGAPGKEKNTVFIYTFDSNNGWQYQTTIHAPDSPPLPSSPARVGFGSSIAMSNDGLRLLIGAPYEDSGARGVQNLLAGRAAQTVQTVQTDFNVFNSGTAYLYKRNMNTGSWSLTTQFKANATDQSDEFGRAVSISGDGKTIAVGAAREDSADANNDSDNTAIDAGAVYIFKLNNSGDWTQEAYIKASTISAGDRFGSSLSLDGSGNSLLIGASDADMVPRSPGVIYYFNRVGTSWTEQQLLVEDTSSSLNSFGGNVAISDDGNTFIASAKGENTYTGAAYVFVLDAGTWVKQIRLTPSVLDMEDSFGSSVGISADGNDVIVGAIGEDGSGQYAIGDPMNNNASNAGAAYRFTRTGSTWSAGKYFKATNTDPDDNFGSAAAISSDGETIAVGATGEDSCSSGVDPSGLNDNGCEAAGAVYINPDFIPGFQ